MQKIIIGFFSGIILLSSCKKSDNTFRPLASYTMVNATTDISSAKTYAADHEIPWSTLPTTDNVAQYRFSNYGAYAGNNIIRSVSNADTSIVLYNNGAGKTENFEVGKLNIVFLCGNATAGYEGIFLNNEVPGNYTDSVIGIRFINLSPNSTPLNITLSTSTTTNEASGLAYKAISDYKTYPALSSTGARVFQIRNASGTLLASYTLPVSPASPYTTVGLAHSRFKNITLVIKGLQGTTSGTNALGIFPVAHY